MNDQATAIQFDTADMATAAPIADELLHATIVCPRCWAIVRAMDAVDCLTTDGCLQCPYCQRNLDPQECDPID